jgi:hypothetical protein
MAYLRSGSVMNNEAFVNSGDSAVRYADVIICIIIFRNINKIPFTYARSIILSNVLDPKLFHLC